MSIKWLGGVALVGAAGIAILLSTASAADRIVQVRQYKNGLSGAQTTALANAVEAIFPAAVKANAYLLSCRRVGATDIGCAVFESKSGTAAQFYVDADTAGITVQQDTWDGSTAGWTVIRTLDVLSGAQKTALGTFAAAVWPGAVGANIIALECARNHLEVGSQINCFIDELQTKSPADALTVKRDFPGSQDAGAVTP